MSFYRQKFEVTIEGTRVLTSKEIEKKLKPYKAKKCRETQRDNLTQYPHVPFHTT